MSRIAESPTNGQRLPAEQADALSAGDGDEFISAATFEEQFGENILETLDLKTWRVGSDLNAEYARIEREVSEAEKLETAQERKIRNEFFPRLAKMRNMPKHTGKHEATVDDISAVHRGLLFNGGVEACDGTIQIHDTLPLTIYQIGVGMVSYRGDQGTWGQRLFRRDLRQKGVDVDEWLEFLERRARRDSPTQMPGQDHLGELVQKAILDYAERAILLERSAAPWRLGHGNPLTYELLTGGGNLELMVAGTGVLRQLVERHQKFIFVAGEPRERLFMTIGQALRPLEFAIVGSLDDRLKTWLHQKRFKVNVDKRLLWDDELIPPTEWIPRIIESVASKIVVGLFKPTLFASAQLFYAHEDYADIAGHIALADCVLKEQGNSFLLEMAQHVCNSVFGENLEALAESAYIATGAHHRFLNGRLHRAR